MPQRVILLLIAGFACFGSAHADSTAPGATPPPFWEGKPKIVAKLRDERAVLVSVRTAKGLVDKDADLFTINGVGWVKRDAATIFALAQQYERMKDVSDMFREVKAEPKTHRVFVICQALGYQARMLLTVEPGEGPPREIAFKVIDGHFQGLTGTMAFRELPESQAPQPSAQTEVTFRVHLEAREIPIPRILVGFALEVLVQKVAVKMRTHFEEAPLAWPGHEAKPSEEPKPVATPDGQATPAPFMAPKAKLAPKKVRTAPGKSNAH
jgi:hypothetical protein